MIKIIQIIHTNDLQKNLVSTKNPSFELYKKKKIQTIHTDDPSFHYNKRSIIKNPIVHQYN